MLESARCLGGINLFHSVQIQMQRKFQISKQTEDKVKLARQFIEHKYQSILRQEQQLQVNWQKVLHIMDTSNLKAPQKKILAERILQQETLNKRISRQRDCLANYHLYQLIGRGAFGQVKLARDKVTGDLVVIKRMSKSKLIGKKQISSAYLEREFMIKNASKYLVELKSTFQDKEYVYIAMEYVCGGDLLHLLIDKDIFSQEQTRFYIAELVLAIEKVHSMNYIHRDIKPDNILIGRDGHIKISDFGLSKYIEPRKTVLTKMASLRKHTELREGRTKAYSKVGTPDYIAPQVLTEETYSQNADIWSIGVIMFQCLFGYPPFSHEDSREVCQRVMNWPKYLEFPKDCHVSNEAYDLILGTMTHCEERLTIRQIKMHPFFEGINWGRISELKPPYIPVLKSELDTHNFEQFDNVDWIALESEGNQFGNQRQRSHSSHAHFAGFDFVKKGDDTIVDTAVRQIKAILQPYKSLQKCQMSPFIKGHVDFLECSSSKMSKKGLLARKSSKMLRSSSKENNMSLKDFRKVKKCSLPKRTNGFKLQAL